ncbi:MAG: hypothetical protein GY796_05330 [Chloroflexi bacterium]|nr:hypothetical protein [Chloroflexota bacterium]
MSVETRNGRVTSLRQRLWWLVILQGLAVIIMSLFLFLKPIGTILLVTLFLGGYLVLNGLVDILFSILGRHVDGRLGTFLKGLISSFVGGFIILMPMFTASSLAGWFFLVVAIALLIFGAMRVLLKPKDGGGRHITDILIGLLMILLAIAMFTAPLFSLELLVTLLALWGGITGILMIIDGFELRSLKQFRAGG